MLDVYIAAVLFLLITAGAAWAQEYDFKTRTFTWAGFLIRWVIFMVLWAVAIALAVWISSLWL